MKGHLTIGEKIIKIPVYVRIGGSEIEVGAFEMEVEALVVDTHNLIGNQGEDYAEVPD